jgi:DNA-binding Lrp family transcriptional regulator
MNPLLTLLEDNALASPETLAAQLNLSPDEVRRQIEQLERDRVILAYKAIVDDERAHRTGVRAVIEVRITPEREGGFDRLAHRIAQYREVQSCFLMSGGFDLLIFIEGATLQEVGRFVS